MAELNAPLMEICSLCAQDPTAFHRNALIEFAYCPHERVGLAKPEVGGWQVMRNLTPVMFADFTITMTMISAFDQDFWTRIIAPGSEGLK
jgi:hypothetical protein